MLEQAWLQRFDSDQALRHSVMHQAEPGVDASGSAGEIRSCKHLTGGGGPPQESALGLCGWSTEHPQRAGCWPQSRPAQPG
ncbi:unnamed protein product [Boreogadus saida]